MPSIYQQNTCNDQTGVVLYPVHIHLTDYCTSVHSFLTKNAQETAFNTKGTSENYVVYLLGLLF